jgi:hypothetical protein
MDLVPSSYEFYDVFHSLYTTAIDDLFFIYLEHFALESRRFPSIQLSSLSALPPFFLHLLPRHFLDYALPMHFPHSHRIHTSHVQPAFFLFSIIIKICPLLPFHHHRLMPASIAWFQVIFYAFFTRIRHPASHWSVNSSLARFPASETFFIRPRHQQPSAFQHVVLVKIFLLLLSTHNAVVGIHSIPLFWQHFYSWGQRLSTTTTPSTEKDIVLLLSLLRRACAFSKLTKIESLFYLNHHPTPNNHPLLVMPKTETCISPPNLYNTAPACIRFDSLVSLEVRSPLLSLVERTPFDRPQASRVFLSYPFKTVTFRSTVCYNPPCTLH